MKRRVFAGVIFVVVFSFIVMQLVIAGPYGPGDSMDLKCEIIDNKIICQYGDGSKYESELNPKRVITREDLLNDKSPRIIRTGPRRNSFTNGEDFFVRYSEEYLREVELVVTEIGGDLTDPQRFQETNCPYGRGKECNVFMTLYPPKEEQMIEYYFIVKDMAGNSVRSRPVLVNYDALPPKINSFNYDINRRRVNFIFNITEGNFDKMEYYDHNDPRPRWKRFCSRLRGDICRVKKGFRTGDHNIDFRVLDMAGNYAEESVSFIIE